MNDFLKTNCITTRTGLILDFNNPHPDSIEITDIAAGLARICRFGGQLADGMFYSVAEHSVHCVNLAKKDGIEDVDILLPIFLHDAAEAYCGDVVKPLKLVLGECYTDIEKRVENVIAEAFGIDFDKHHDIIKKYDIEMVVAEKKRLFTNIYYELPNVRNVDVNFNFFDFNKAEQLFLTTYWNLIYENAT